jgi:hypothetical protein
MARPGGIPFRESSFLENPKIPDSVQKSKLQISMCKVDLKQFVAAIVHLKRPSCHVSASADKAFHLRSVDCTLQRVEVKGVQRIVCTVCRKERPAHPQILS